ncbi:MAG: NUDIX domain-containing protein [Micropruina sp.]|uniref:NUDIX domain-containing protein n=1 Tax=Micropruina sp. TaxID=2737536 RepID=UPI0039E5AB85
MLQVVGAAIVRRGTVLSARRSYPAAEAGRWEFPGGKVDPGESPETALTREIAEELGCAVEVVGWLPDAVRGDDRGRELELRVALCRLVDGEPSGTEHDALRWLAPEQLDDVDWLEPDRPFLPRLRELLLDGDRLPGGNVGGAVRIGTTVRRPIGPWTPAVHALLRHLAAAGLPAVPRVHGLDARGREILDYLPGEVIDVDAEQLSDARLASLGRWLRGLHDASAGFEHPGPWRFFGVETPTQITHNDAAPYNVAFRGDEVSGVFDWDLAGPSTPVHDLGHTAWSAIPLFRPIPADQAARRLTVFADAYGTDPATVLDSVRPRVQLAVDGIREAVRRGDEGMINLAAQGEPERTERALAGFLERRDAIRALL